jgi:hypothetical protein
MVSLYLLADALLCVPGAIACLFKDTRGGFSQQNRQPAQNLRTEPARSNQKPNIAQILI